MVFEGLRLSKRDRGLGAKLYIAAIITFLFFPVIVMVLLSFNSSTRLGLPIEGLTLDQYDNALSAPALSEAIPNTLIAAGATAVLAALLGTLTALGLSRVKPITAAIGSGLSLLPALVPPLLLGAALNITLRALGINQGLAPIIVGHTLIATPFVALVMIARLREFDFTLPQAARDLGASPRGAFLDVTLPLIRAPLVGAMMLAGALSLDEFVITFFVRGTSDTVPVVLWGLIRRDVDPMISALGALLLFSILALALVSLRLIRVRT